MANFLGKDKYGSEWYARITEEGKQIWAQVRNEEIRNGGINDSIKLFHHDTGLSSPVKPK
ncbi:hypothetical protein [Clostridium aciditolerans]|uniref:Uncharacterized protein n=1 Tax=Clostridium aciditolerans TaxID=339861 RepID=A0A934M2D0_9CLOT|nr:hypothetical protein [Clostridium aciditolerans]MBI6871800.1 hypothetical protein [Clostridium aciditolerans]